MPDGNTARVLSFVHWSKSVIIPVSMKPLDEILKLSGLRCLDLDKFSRVRHSIIKEDFFRIAFAQTISANTSPEQLYATLFCNGRRPPLLREFILAYLCHAKKLLAPTWMCLTPFQENDLSYFPIINGDKNIFFAPMIGKVRKDVVYPVVVPSFFDF